MALWDRVQQALALNPAAHPLIDSRPIEAAQPLGQIRRLSTGDDERLTRIQRQNLPRPWRPATIREALSIPAFFEAVTLISNMMGIFTLQAYQNGERVADADRPRILVRPNPFTTLRDYLRETGWSMATRGENWQWIAARDVDNQPLSVIPVPSHEVKVTGDWLTPKVLWRNVPKTSDFTSVFLTKELGDNRGKGPLQYCGAAISAAVESQEWAANFYAIGGNPNVIIHSEMELDEEEAHKLREQWTETPPNMPQVTSGPIDAKAFDNAGPSAQMLDARNWNAGEGARMFQIPGPLLEYSRGGSSLSYTNVVTLMDQLLKQCLIPNYLEPVEQMMSDLLPRSWITRFNVDAILRADIKTRFEVYESGLRSGVYPDVTLPQQAEGIVAGSIETAPVPVSPPSAFPSNVPTQPPGSFRPFSADDEWRCQSCGKKLAEVRGSGTTLRCRCGELAVA